MSGFTWAKLRSGPRELKLAVSGMKLLPGETMRMGNCEIVPTAGSPPWVVMMLIRY